MSASDLMQLPSFVPGSAEWVEQRRRSVGGSEIAPILGIGKWESRFSLWFRKQGTIGPQDDNPGMEWGRRLEVVIAQKYADEHPDLYVDAGGSWTRESRPWQLASPDRVVSDAGSGPGHLLEVKTDHFADEWGEPGTDQIPVYYRAQCLWYLDVLELDRCDVAVLIGGSDYREYTVRYDQAEAEFMRAEAQAFIASLDTGERPRIDEHQATHQAIRVMHPDITPDEIELPADLARSYCTARHALKAADNEAKRQASLVADHIGDARRATFLGDTIATRQAKGNGTPYLVAARNLPDFGTEAA